MKTLIFDIGKTNKKALVFDRDYQVVDEKQTSFDEIADIDGDPTDDVLKIGAWMLEILGGYKNLDITKINIATYGATLAHLDDTGKLIAQPFNYLKKTDPSIKKAFIEENGGVFDFCTKTASPDLDALLNSGFQLYWLKQSKPDFFNKIQHTLHLPQYFSYVLTGQKASEYTSIGCHTMLWNFDQKDYHAWVKKERLHRLFPQLLPVYTTFPKAQSSMLQVGIGMHDSSAALIPYLATEKNPFLLLSTGTWSICMNPFNTAPLTADELARDCLFYMRPDGEIVKASRLFSGKLHDEAVENLCAQYHQSVEATKQVRFNPELYDAIRKGLKTISNAGNLEEAYHVVIYELIRAQVEKIYLAAGKTVFNKIMVDGGFAKNELYLNMLKKALPDVRIEAGDMPQGTALGAAMALDNGIFYSKN
jgi:L-fuculokinase